MQCQRSFHILEWTHRRPEGSLPRRIMQRYSTMIVISNWVEIPRSWVIWSVNKLGRGGSMFIFWKLTFCLLEAEGWEMSSQRTVYGNMPAQPQHCAQRLWFLATDLYWPRPAAAYQRPLVLSLICLLSAASVELLSWVGGSHSVGDLEREPGIGVDLDHHPNCPAPASWKQSKCYSWLLGQSFSRGATVLLFQYTYCPIRKWRFQKSLLNEVHSTCSEWIMEKSNFRDV